MIGIRPAATVVKLAQQTGHGYIVDVTVHVANEIIDDGPRISVSPFVVSPTSTVEGLARTIGVLEGPNLVEALTTIYHAVNEGREIEEPATSFRLHKGEEMAFEEAKAWALTQPAFPDPATGNKPPR